MLGLHLATHWQRNWSAAISVDAPCPPHVEAPSTLVLLAFDESHYFCWFCTDPNIFGNVNDTKAYRAGVKGVPSVSRIVTGRNGCLRDREYP